MKQDWSVRNEIMKRVQKEADEIWAKTSDTVSVPPYKKCENIKATAGWYNFISEVMRDLRP